MSKGVCEYNGLVASSWDFLRGDTSEFPDRRFYRELIEENGEPILVVGCGTGRLLLEYLQNRWVVDGLDVSPEMLAICGQKAKERQLSVRLYQQAMERMQLEKKYKTIIVPSLAFQLVTALEDAKSTLLRFFKHLLPGGKLALAFWHIKGEARSDWSEWWVVSEREGFEGEKMLKRWERSRYDPNTRLRHTENRYEILAGDDIIYTELHQKSPEMRNYALPEVIGMMREAGFAEINAFKEFSPDPATEADGVFSIIASIAKT